MADDVFGEVGAIDELVEIKAGFDAHLVKPVTEFDLFQAIAFSRSTSLGALIE